MKCDRMNDLFGDLHDGLLDGTTTETVRHHLGDCPECREDFKWYGFTVQALANLETVTPPANFVAQVRARCDASESFWSFYSFKETFSSLPYLPLPVGVTAAVVMGMFALGLYNYAPTYIPTSVAAPPHVQAAPSGPPIKLPQAVQAGTNKLFVESPRIDVAVESLKRILPDIQGKVLEDRRPGDVGGTPVLAVVIPHQFYGDLMRELINHGAVVAGPPSSQTDSPSQPGGDANQVFYIQFKSR